MRQSRRIATLFILISTFILAAPAALAHQPHTVKVRTVAELVAAMNAANASGRPTLIKVAPGTCDLAFPRQFESEVGPGRLPPVTGTMALVASDASRTVFRASHGGNNGEFARILTVLKSGALLVRGITLTGGFVLCELEDGCLTNGGGAALNAGGILWFEDSVIRANSAP